MKQTRSSQFTTVIAGVVLGLALSGVAFAAVRRIEAQPLMRKAKVHLLDAEELLEKATPDKGGHREIAIKLVKDAIDEVDKGIAFDDKH